MEITVVVREALERALQQPEKLEETAVEIRKLWEAGIAEDTDGQRLLRGVHSGMALLLLADARVAAFVQFIEGSMASWLYVGWLAGLEAGKKAGEVAALEQLAGGGGR